MDEAYEDEPEPLEIVPVPVPSHAHDPEAGCPAVVRLFFSAGRTAVVLVVSAAAPAEA